MPVFEDWLKSPLSIINNLYGINQFFFVNFKITSLLYLFSKLASDPSNFEQKLQEYFDNKLKTEKSYLSVFYLN